MLFGEIRASAVDYRIEDTLDSPLMTE